MHQPDRQPMHHPRPDQQGRDAPLEAGFFLLSLLLRPVGWVVHGGIFSLEQ
jgi:hypothetical protein